MSQKQAKRARQALRAQGIDTTKAPKRPTRHHIAKSDLRKKRLAFGVTLAAAANRLKEEGFLDETGTPTGKAAS